MLIQYFLVPYICLFFYDNLNKCITVLSYFFLVIKKNLSVRVADRSVD